MLGSCSKKELLFFYDTKFHDIGEIDPALFSRDSRTFVFRQMEKIASGKNLEFVPVELKDENNYFDDIFTAFSERSISGKVPAVVMTSYIFTADKRVREMNLGTRCGVVGPMSGYEYDGMEICGGGLDVMSGLGTSCAGSGFDNILLTFDDPLYIAMADAFERGMGEGSKINRSVIGAYDANVRQPVFNAMRSGTEVNIIIPQCLALKKILALKPEYPCHIFVVNYPFFPVYDTDSNADLIIPYDYAASFRSVLDAILDEKNEDAAAGFCYGFELDRQP